MNYLEILQYAWAYGPRIKAILDEASSNDDITTKIKKLSPTLASLLEQAGAAFFPAAAPAIHIVAGAIAAFDPDVTKWLQGALNKMLTPSPNLTVDGRYGPRTRAAVEQLQTKLGLKIDGVAGTITQAAITKILG